MSFGENFLSHPESFGAASGLTPWGQAVVGIRVAGTAFRFTGLSETQAELIRHHYADYLLTEAAPKLPPIHTQVVRTASNTFRSIDQRGWTYNLDLDYQPDRIRIAGLNLMAIIDCANALAATLWVPSEHPQDFRLSFDNFFRMLAAYTVLARGGVMLHSAGVSDGERAWIGFGHSGAGKSTFAGLALAAGHRVLSDDINVLCHEEGYWRARRMPFAGELGPTHGDDRAYPVVGLLRLHKGTEHGLTPLGRPRSLAALVGSAPYVNRDPYRSPVLMANLESLLASLSCHDLTFRKDPGFWPLLTAAIEPAPPRDSTTGVPSEWGPNRTP